jgi:hypothetical protein
MSEDAAPAPSGLAPADLARLRAEAVGARSPFVSPALLREGASLLGAVPDAWLAHVVGVQVPSWRYLTNQELHLAVAAAKEDAAWLTADREAGMAEYRAIAAAEDAKRAATAMAAAAEWETLRAALPAPVAVCHNWTARHLDGYEQGGDHIVLLEDLHAGRLHRSARSPLCWTPSRAHELRHVSAAADDEDRLPNCKACLRTARQLGSA